MDNEIDLDDGERPPFVCDEMVTFRLHLRALDVVFFKGLLEAEEGLAQMYAKKGGVIVVATTKSQAGDLADFLGDIVGSLRAEFADDDGHLFSTPSAYDLGVGDQGLEP